MFIGYSMRLSSISLWAESACRQCLGGQWKLDGASVLKHRRTRLVWVAENSMVCLVAGRFSIIASMVDANPCTASLCRPCDLSVGRPAPAEVVRYRPRSTAASSDLAGGMHCSTGSRGYQVKNAICLIQDQALQLGAVKAWRLVHVLQQAPRGAD